MECPLFRIHRNRRGNDVLHVSSLEVSYVPDRKPVADEQLPHVGNSSP